MMILVMVLVMEDGVDGEDDDDDDYMTFTPDKLYKV